ncbi:MAG: DegT/DnrJ/EryC1/StrS family aminotransferase [Planctomycetota bacterium]
MSTNAISMVALGPDEADEREEWLAALGSVIDRSAFCLGSEVEEFEREVKELLGVHAALGVANGSDALRIALQALAIGPGDEVIVPAYSFFASASSIAHLGARPRFVDVSRDTLTLDPEALTAAANDLTKAVMPVHLYGQAAALDAIGPWCAQRRITIVEDAAQAFGVRHRGIALGGVGAAGTFSFYPTKNLGAPGDAGMVITREPEVAERVRMLRAHGDRGGYRHEALGWNARLDGFQAAILRIRLRRLPHIQELRSRNARLYLEGLAAKSLLDDVRPLGRTPGSEHGWHQFIVFVEERPHVQAVLRERGIASGVYYPSTLPSQPAFASLGHRTGEFPVAEYASRCALALPIHHRVTPTDVERVVEALAYAVRGAS